MMHRTLTLLFVLTLAGCAGTREDRAARLQAPQITAPIQAEDGRTDSIVESANGESITLSHWRTETPAKATILAVHGYGDYGLSTYGEAAKGWAAQGIETYAYDQRGFGRNPSNSVWPGADRLVDDLALMADLVRERAPDTPLIIVGHSMGGGVVTAALGEGRVTPDAAILLAPALWGGDNLNLGYRMLAGLAATLFPDKRWSGKGVVRILASDNIPMLRALGRDPLYVRKPSSREFAGLIAIMDRAVEGAPHITTPTLVLYGAKDEVIPEAPTRETAALFSGPTEFRLIETGWHLLLRDLEGQIVRDAVADFALSKN